jgi:hypothetical protein
MSYGPPPSTGYPTPGYGPPPPNHPQATTVMVLGILSLAVCGVLGIPAWIMGNRVVREIDASRGTVGGRGSAQAGRICGILATVLLGLGVGLVVVLFLFFAVLGATVSTSG